MTTDTSERGLERLICTALTGAACDPGRASASRTTSDPSTYGAGWICGEPEDYDREYCVDLAQLSRLPARDAAGRRRRARPRPGRPDAAEVPRPPAGRDHQARRDRRAAPRHQARAASARPLLRHAVAGQREGRGALRGQPLQRHPAAPLQPRRDAARARPRACSSTACRSRPSS